MVEPAGLEERFRALPDLRWGEFANADGARIRYCSTVAPTPAADTIVLVPGYSEHAEKYFETMRDFLRLGYCVWEMDWRGVGGSEHFLPDTHRGYSLGFDRDVRDLDQFIRTVVDVPAGGRVFLVSHSMGGHIALRYVQEHPGAVQAAVFSAPALSVGPPGALAQWLARRYVKAMVGMGFGSAYLFGGHAWRESDGVPDGLTHDPERAALQRRWFTANPALRLGVMPTHRWFAELVRSCDLILEPARLAAIRTPLLFGVPMDDRLVNSGATLAASARIPGARVARFDAAWHELFMEADDVRGPWLAQISALLAAR
jgi:lysophospholipase